MIDTGKFRSKVENTIVENPRVENPRFEQSGILRSGKNQEWKKPGWKIPVRSLRQFQIFAISHCNQLSHSDLQMSSITMKYQYEKQDDL